MSQTDTRPPVQSAPVAQCQYKTDKGRQCKLDAGHDTVAGHPQGEKHRMVLRDQVAAPPSLTELRRQGVSFALKMEAVPKNADLGREYSREAAPRDTDQQRVDKDAQTAYDKWVQSGRPKEFEKSPVQRYIFPPEAFDTVVAMLRRATTSGGPVAGKSLKYRRKTHESGNAMIFFTITDRSVSDQVQQSITGA